MIEDLTKTYGEGEYYVLGYWNRGNTEFMYYVSLLFADGYDEFIDIEIIEVEGMRAYAIRKFDVLAAAEALGYAEGDYNVMFTFVPVGADGSDDYAIVFTEEEEEITEISDSAELIYFVGIDQMISIKITPTENGTWVFTSNSPERKDSYATLLDSDGIVLDQNDDGASNLQFRIIRELEAGKTYELQVRWLSGNNYGYMPVIATFTPAA